MKSLLRSALDLRVLWIFAPLWGNVIFLPVLLSAFFSDCRERLSAFLRLHIVLSLTFFGYFALRGLVALPDDGLSGAMSRISPVLIIALLIWVRPPELSYLTRLKLIAVAPIVVLILALLEQFIDPSISRSSLLAGNPLFLTPAVIPLVYLNAFLALRSKFQAARVIHYTGLLAALLVIGTLAGSRSSYLVALGTLGLHLIWNAIFWSLTAKRAVFSHTVIVIVIAIVGTLAATTLGPSAERMANFVTSVSSAMYSDVRFEIWTGAFSAIQDQPIFGYGPQNRWSAIAPYLREATASLELSHPHNLILTLGMSGGIVGILVGFAYIVGPNVYAFFSTKFVWPEKELFLIAPAGVFVFGQANYVLFEGYMAVVTTLTLIGPYLLLQSQRDQNYQWDAKATPNHPT